MKSLIKILGLTTVLTSLLIEAKVLIFTYSYNRPDFIEIQYKTFKKFVLDDYEFIVFNDAIDDEMRLKIEQMCNTYHIRCIRIPQEIHDPIYNASVRNCAVVKYSLEKIGFAHDDIVALFDSDLFLIKEFSIKEYMQDYDIAGQWQNRDNINYLWIGLVFLNMATMPNKTTINFDLGRIENSQTDSGGFTHYYLKNNPTTRVRWFDNIVYLADLTCNNCKKNKTPICYHLTSTMKELEFSNPLIYLAYLSRNSISEVYLKNTFFHYRAGSNWNCDSSEYHQQKTKLINNFFKQCGI